MGKMMRRRNGYQAIKSIATINPYIANPSPRATNSSDQIESSGFWISISEPALTAVMIHRAAANPQPIIVNAPIRVPHASAGITSPSPPPPINMKSKQNTIKIAVMAPHEPMLSSVDLILFSSPPPLATKVISTSPSNDISPIANITGEEICPVSKISPSRNP